jgi:hypothetical protein
MEALRKGSPGLPSGVSLACSRRISAGNGGEFNAERHAQS